MTEHITGRRNPLVTHIRKVRDDRAYRRACGEFLGDGDKLLAEAAQSGAPLTTVVMTPGMPLPAQIGSARVVTVPADVMESISPMRSPQGALFLCRMPDLTPPARLTGRRYLILDGLQDPGNLGTIWRTADAFGADGLFLVHACADPFGHKAVRASMGACFRLPVWETDPAPLAALLRGAGLTLTAAALTDSAADLRGCGSLGAAVIGSEGRGVSPEMLALCDGAVRIPMRARCESLNAAAAAAVILWEMAKDIE